ncbi:unnamed protein product [Larinioides sclopetarius]|uniref:Uncharacterized protein n=1 Tax=Larinioides sclopetarius TaxID=280406 RepID=A0AAV1ZJ43_9ARAC
MVDVQAPCSCGGPCEFDVQILLTKREIGYCQTPVLFARLTSRKNSSKSEMLFACIRQLSNARTKAHDKSLQTEETASLAGGS